MTAAQTKVYDRTNIQDGSCVLVTNGTGSTDNAAHYVAYAREYMQ